MTKSVASRHPSRVAAAANNRTPLAQRADTLLTDLFHASTEAVEPLISAERVQELKQQQAAEAAAPTDEPQAPIAAVSAGRGGSRKRGGGRGGRGSGRGRGRVQQTKAGRRSSKTQPQELAGGSTSAAAVAAAAAALTAAAAAAGSPKLMGAGTAAGGAAAGDEDDLNFVSDLLLSDDDDLLALLGQVEAPGPDGSAATAPAPLLLATRPPPAVGTGSGLGAGTCDPAAAPAAPAAASTTPVMPAAAPAAVVGLLAPPPGLQHCVARAIEPGFDASAAAAAAVRADLNGDRGAASGAGFIPVEQMLAGFGGGFEQHQPLPPEHPSEPPPLQQQPASGGFMALLNSDDPPAAADALAIGAATSLQLPPPCPTAGDAAGGWGEAAGSSNSLGAAAGTWLHPEGQQQPGAPMLANGALHGGAPFLHGGQLLLPGAGGLSGSNQNYLQHQQRMMLAHQQHQTHLQVRFVAEEKARRKEKKRARRLLKQQQNGQAGLGQQQAAAAPAYGSALLGAGRYTFTGDASAAVMAAAARGPLTYDASAANTRLFPSPAAAGGRSSSGVLSRYSPYPAGSPLQLSRAASMGGELPAPAGAAPGAAAAAAAAGAWGAPRMLQSRSLPSLLRLPGVPVTDEDTGQLGVLEGVVVSMPAGEAAGVSTTPALGQQQQQPFSHPRVQTSPLSTNTQQQLPQLQHQLSAAERVLQHAGASGTLAPGQPLGLAHGGGSMGSQQLMQRAGSARLAEGAGTPGALLSLTGLPSLQTQQQPGQAARAAPRRKGKAAAAGASGGANGEAGNGPGVDLAVSSSIMRTSSGKVLRMLTHPVTGQTLLLGPAVDAKTSRLGSTALGAPVPQMFGVDLRTARSQQAEALAAAAASAAAAPPSRPWDTNSSGMMGMLFGMPPPLLAADDQRRITSGFGGGWQQQQQPVPPPPQQQWQPEQLQGGFAASAGGAGGGSFAPSWLGTGGVQGVEPAAESGPYYADDGLRM